MKTKLTALLLLIIFIVSSTVDYHTLTQEDVKTFKHIEETKEEVSCYVC